MISDEQGGAPVVSVVIHVFNEEHRICSCLRSILNQHTKLPYEIIVVDSSTDRTRHIIQDEFPTVRLIHRERQTFPAEARNIGIEQSRGSIVAFIDADCVAETTWIDAIVAAHNRNYLAVGGAVSLATPHTLFGALLFAIEFSEFVPTSGPRECGWLPSCNLSVKRAAFEPYGRFPTDMEASEDILFSRRMMVKSGMPVWFEPRIRINHANLNTLAEYQQKLQKLGYWSGRSRGSGLLPGGFLLRFPWLTPWLVPYRAANILIRLFRAQGQTRLFVLCFLCWPLLLYGLMWWSWGFHRGVVEARRQREHSA